MPTVRKALLVLTYFILLWANFLSAQCPDHNTLWIRLKNIRTSKLPPATLLSGLLSTRDSLVTCNRTNDSTYIYLLRKIADLYFDQADYLTAVQYRRKAIEITNANAGHPAVKTNDLPGIYYWLSIAYDSLDNFSGKMNALDSAAAIAMRLKNMDRASLMALYTRVEYYFDIGDYHRCIDYAIKCEQLARDYVSIVPTVGADYVSSSLGWQVEALLQLQLYEQAENILANKIDIYKKAGLTSYLGLVYNQSARVQEQKGNFEKALSYFKQSLAYYQKDKDYLNCKQTLKDIGYQVYARHFNDEDKALAYYRKALTYVFTRGDSFSKTYYDFESLNIYANIGAVYTEKGYYDSAFTYFQLAFDQIKLGSTEADILNSTPQEMMQFKTNYYLTDLLINKGYAFRKLYESNHQKNVLDKAIGIYKTADQLLDRIKAEQTDLKSKLFWRRDSRRLYENAIEACYLQGNVRDAFYFFEKSRAVLLNDQLNEKKFAAEKDIMQQTEIQKKIWQLQNEFDKTDKRSARYATLQNELFSRKQELDNLKQVIKTKNPLYYQSFLDSTFITVADIKQKILNDHTALVEIFTGDSAVYVLAITKQNIHLQKIEKAGYEKLTGSFIDYISNADVLNRNYEAFRKVSADLYHLIFQHIALGPGRLIISPDEQYFPFEALLTNKQGQPEKWFVEDHAVSYTYSARFLLNDFNTKQIAGSNFLGMAPVHYPPDFSLASLQGSDQSLYTIAGYFSNADNRVLLDASRKNFLNQFSKYRIIQLYTHAADSSVNNEPIIYFADSALYLSDLINEYKPYTRLVVLSACETGKGKIYQGEGVFSFNRGFASLGIPAAITNLWSVDDEATYQLTELFYKWLAKGLPTDLALQKAKLEFLQTASRERSMPCYWAGPVLVGKTDTIELSKPDHWKWLVVVGGIACVVVFMGRRRFLGGKVKRER